MINTKNNDDFTINGGCKPLTEPIDQMKIFDEIYKR